MPYPNINHHLAQQTNRGASQKPLDALMNHFRPMKAQSLAAPTRHAPLFSAGVISGDASSPIAGTQTMGNLPVL